MLSIKTMAPLLAITAVLALGVMTDPARADDQQIRFENHQFTPSTLAVRSGQPFKIKVVNASNETIEFESFKLNREQSVQPGETITVKLPALSPGTYDFYDDFHQDVPQGSIVAR
jgi:plastocyanin